MSQISSFFTLIFVLVSWKIVCSEERQNIDDDMNKLLEKDIFQVKDDRLGHDIPDLRFVLNNLLRYDDTVRHPAGDQMFTLYSRSKNTPISSDDPLAVLATGFHGSRGKRQSYTEIPVFANGFPANRGRK